MYVAHRIQVQFVDGRIEIHEYIDYRHYNFDKNNDLFFITVLKIISRMQKTIWRFTFFGTKISSSVLPKVFSS